MVEEFSFYLIKTDYLYLVGDLGGNYPDYKSRPMLIIPDGDTEGIYWAIPLSSYENKTDLQKRKIEGYMSKDKSNSQSSFYHLIQTNRISVLNISNALPVTEGDLFREYTFGGKRLVISDVAEKYEIWKKLSTVIQRSRTHPEKSVTKAAVVYEYLKEEIAGRTEEKQPAVEELVDQAKLRAAEKNEDRERRTRTRKSAR